MQDQRGCDKIPNKKKCYLEGMKQIAGGIRGWRFHGPERLWNIAMKEECMKNISQHLVAGGRGRRKSRNGEVEGRS